MSVATVGKASEQNTFLSVLLISFMIFIFFKFCLGAPLPIKTMDTVYGGALIKSTESVIQNDGFKCPTGSTFNSQKQNCKQIKSNKKFSEGLWSTLQQQKYLHSWEDHLRRKAPIK